MRVTKFHPELAPPPLGKNFEEGTEPTGDGWVDHPSEFPNTKVYLYHPWKAPRGETFEQGEEPQEPGWVTSKKHLPTMPDPLGPIYNEKRIPALVRVAEVLRARGFPEVEIKRHLETVNQRECLPAVEVHSLDEVVQGTTPIGMPHLSFVLQDVADELARQGKSIEPAYETLNDLNTNRGNSALGDDDMQQFYNRFS